MSDAPHYRGRSKAIHVLESVTTPSVVPAGPEQEVDKPTYRGRSAAIRVMEGSPSLDLRDITGPLYAGPHYRGVSQAIHVHGPKTIRPIIPVPSCNCEDYGVGCAVISDPFDNTPGAVNCIPIYACGPNDGGLGVFDDFNRTLSDDAGTPSSGIGGPYFTYGSGSAKADVNGSALVATSISPLSMEGFSTVGLHLKLPFTVEVDFAGSGEQLSLSMQVATGGPFFTYHAFIDQGDVVATTPVSWLETQVNAFQGPSVPPTFLGHRALGDPVYGTRITIYATAEGVTVNGLYQPWRAPVGSTGDYYNPPEIVLADTVRFTTFEMTVVATDAGPSSMTVDEIRIKDANNTIPGSENCTHIGNQQWQNPTYLPDVPCEGGSLDTFNRTVAESTPGGFGQTEIETPAGFPTWAAPTAYGKDRSSVSVADGAKMRGHPSGNDSDPTFGLYYVRLDVSDTSLEDVFEFLYKARVGGSSGTTLGYPKSALGLIIIKTGGDNRTFVDLAFEYVTSTQLKLQLYADDYGVDDLTTLINVNHTTTDCWIRVRQDGSNTSVKVWQDGDTEPGSWTSQLARDSMATTPPNRIQWAYGWAYPTTDAYVRSFEITDGYACMIPGGVDDPGGAVGGIGFGGGSGAGGGSGSSCPFDDLSSPEWSTGLIPPSADPDMEYEFGTGVIAARQIEGTVHTNAESAVITAIRDLTAHPDLAEISQDGTWRFPYRVWGTYGLSDSSRPYTRVRAQVSFASSSVQVSVERNEGAGITATDLVTVTCPSGVGGTFTIPRTMNLGYIDIVVTTGSVTVTVQGVSQTYSPAGLTPDPESVQLVVEVISTDVGTPLAEGRINGVYFVPAAGGGSVSWCDSCTECTDDETGFPFPDFDPNYLPTFRRQIGDPTTNLDSYICTMESGAMVLAWHTQGAVDVWGGELIPWSGRTEASILGSGTNLNDVQQAWRHWGLSFSVRSGQTWTQLLQCLAEGRAVVLQGDYDQLAGSEKCQAGFEGNHAMALLPFIQSSRVLTGDPLCNGWKGRDLASLKDYAEDFGIQVFGVTSPQKILFGVSRPWAA